MWDWERHIPFVREFIVPYWSLDLFFCGAFFLCRSRAELNLLTKRLVAVHLPVIVRQDSILSRPHFIKKELAAIIRAITCAAVIAFLQFY